jgi:RNA polymerase sigma factor (sigma-70 family)
MRDFEEWYQQLYPRLVTTLSVTLGSADEASEVAADAFLSAYSQWDRVAAMENPDGWTYRAAVNRARRRGRRRHAERGFAHFLAPSRPSESDDLAALRELLEDLPPRMRQVVALRHVADLTEIAVGEVLGISRGTVSSTLRDAYERLSRQIETEEQR